MHLETYEIPKEYIPTYEELREDNRRLIKDINRKDKELDYKDIIIEGLCELFKINYKL